MAVRASQAYFRRLDGRWAGTLRFRITDWRAFLGASMGRWDRVRLLLLACACALLGPVRLVTTLDATKVGGLRLRHGTSVRGLGLLLYEGVEDILLDPDGRTFRVVGERRTFPFLGEWSDWGEDAGGEVEVSGQGASYDLPWFGTRLRQTTRMVPAGLLVIQLSPWSRAVVTLSRTGPR